MFCNTQLYAQTQARLQQHKCFCCRTVFNQLIIYFLLIYMNHTITGHILFAHFINPKNPCVTVMHHYTGITYTHTHTSGHWNRPHTPTNNTNTHLPQRPQVDRKTKVRRLDFWHAGGELWIINNHIRLRWQIICHQLVKQR